MNAVREDDLKQIIAKIPYEMCEGQTFLITGANGFLASYVTDTLMYLKQKGFIKRCSVIALCRNRQKAERVFREWLEDRDFHLLIQPVEEKVILEGSVDYIVHAASCSTTHLFASNPADILAANMIGSYHLLELAREKQVKGFLFFSSGAVYGIEDAEEICEGEICSINYLKPKNSYAVGKRAGEALCSAYWSQYQVPAKGVRISHTYGPGIDLNDGHVYSDFAKSIIEYKDLVIKGDGLAARPFCYVSDAVSAFFIILFKGAAGEMYNMANPQMNVTIKELADLLTQKVFPERGLQVIVENPSKEKQSHKTKINIEKLEGLGWKAEVDLNTGFRRLVGSMEEIDERSHDGNV